MQRKKNSQKFNVQVPKSVEKEIFKLEPEIQKVVLSALMELKNSPFPDGKSIKKLSGGKIPFYEKRTGDFRSVYTIRGKMVGILFVVDRKELKEKLKALRKSHRYRDFSR